MKLFPSLFATDPDRASPPGQPMSLVRALSAAFEWMARKAQQGMSSMQNPPQPKQSASMTPQRAQQAVNFTATVISTVVAFAPVRPYSRGLRNSKGDVYFKDRS